jgi:hypothetical protein
MDLKLSQSRSPKRFLILDSLISKYRVANTYIATTYYMLAISQLFSATPAYTAFLFTVTYKTCP